MQNAVMHSLATVFITKCHACRNIFKGCACILISYTFIISIISKYKSCILFFLYFCSHRFDFFYLVFPPFGYSRGYKADHLNSSGDPHTVDELAKATPDALSDAIIPIYHGLGLAIMNAPAYASPVAGEQAGV